MESKIIVIEYQMKVTTHRNAHLKLSVLGASGQYFSVIEYKHQC